MDVITLESEAREAAIKHVSNMLQRPDQLEKVEQYKRRIMRKKVCLHFVCCFNIIWTLF